MLKEGNSYTFRKLQHWLADWENINKFLIVKNVPHNCTAVMHVFQENFSEAYQSGDGVLFYSDGETKSAELTDQFLLISIHSF